MEAAGTTVSNLLDELRERYGQRFDAVLASCAVWVNGEPSGAADLLRRDDEVALLPPVSGG